MRSSLDSEKKIKTQTKLKSQLAIFPMQKTVNLLQKVLAKYLNLLPCYINGLVLPPLSI